MVTIQETCTAQPVSRGTSQESVWKDSVPDLRWSVERRGMLQLTDMPVIDGRCGASKRELVVVIAASSHVHDTRVPGMRRCCVRVLHPRVDPNAINMFSGRGGTFDFV